MGGYQNRRPDQSGQKPYGQNKQAGRGRNPGMMNAPMQPHMQGMNQMQPNMQGQIQALQDQREQMARAQ